MKIYKRGTSARRELNFARKVWWELTPFARANFRLLASKHQLSSFDGDLLLINGSWYVTHSGLLRLANKKRCAGISVKPVRQFCDAPNCRYVFSATVFKSSRCTGFTGYGDADPLNVSSLLHGAEMRIAETRAVNRALRKAYGIGICSVEELGARTHGKQAPANVHKLPPESVGKNGSNGTGARLRDRLCQLIRKHELDGELVKIYATDFCGTKTLREATREQIEAFIVHIADWAEKDRNALLCQLNSYARPQAGVA